MSARRSPLLIVLGAVLALSAACVGTSVAGQEVKSSAPREAANPALIEPAAQDVNAFAVDLYRQIAPGTGNLMLAPWPLQQALGMARAGSTGDTRTQFDQLLHAVPPESFDAGLNALDQHVDALSGERRSDIRKGRVELRQAAALWGQRGTEFTDPYLDTLARYFGTGVRVVDFRSDPEASRRTINTWAEGQTAGRIPSLLNRGTVTQYTRLLVTTGFDLQAPWLVPFDATQTRALPFRRVDGSQAEVASLALQAPFASGIRYAATDQYEAVELPYLGEELGLLVIAPAAGTFTNFDRNLSTDVLGDVVSSLRATAIDLRLPQFQFTTALQLNAPLTTMGLSSAFSRTAADFSGITTDEPLAITDVVYQGYVAIDADGSESSAATVRTPDRRPPVDARRVTIDRPFLFAIRDRSTGLLLELGRVVEPSS